MALLTTSNLSKFYGSKKVFEKLSFSISKNQKVALIGRNGIGKTTLFKIILGKLKPDRGSVHVARDAKIGYLPQKIVYEGQKTIIQIMENNFTHLKKIHKEIIKISQNIKDNEDKYQKLIEEYERKGGYEYETKIKKILTGLNLYEIKNRKFKYLSGGEKMRVGLAQILLNKNDILLLDEPTNHLDLFSSIWLVNYLKGYQGALVIITHDRYVLNNVVDGILDLSEDNIKYYRGNYKNYKKQRAMDFKTKKKEYEKQQKKLEKLKSYVRKYKEGNRSTMAKSREKMIKRIDVIDKPDLFEYNINLNFNNFERPGKEILNIDNFNINGLLEISELTAYRNDKIALIGKNGSGKTTLLRNIFEESDNIDLGYKVEQGFFQQNLKFEKENIPLMDYLNYKYYMDEPEAREILGYFNFSQDSALKLINNLSGGERARLRFLTLIEDSPNFLLLDEPTNHLDLKFLEILENGLKNYNGSLIIVSHDIIFLKNIVNKLWIINDNKIIEYKYDINQKLNEYMISRNNISQEGKIKNEKNSSYEKEKKKRNKRKILLRKAKKIENEIKNIYREIESIEEKMKKEGENPDKLHDYFKEKEKLNEKVEKKLIKLESLKSKLN
ncbi:MAG TPA: ABC-F family ATP-binding cassette domain-containing protein [Candidatus Mcinerneyibacterium sp.]|nr:ABC-F family ATP-binding cassette domain-containing protein [Candidatus Mcinerneyibacterium sp.]